MSIENNNQANIVIPASVISDAIKALQEDRASQRQHEAAAATTIMTTLSFITDKLIAFAREEAAARRAANTQYEIKELYEQIEKLQNDLVVALKG
jgi:hypothetical protein